MFTAVLKNHVNGQPFHRNFLHAVNVRMISFVVLVLCLGLGGCASSPNLKTLSTQDSAPQYHLGAGDRLSIVVFGEENMTGEYDVDDTGVVSVPLAGRIPVTGLTPIELEGAINKRLAKGLVANPRVAVSVVKYRPFYIIGEVQHPGAYAYFSGATVLSAVAQAGGYTYRAKTENVEVVRPDGADRSPKLATQEAYLEPGDILIVPLRWF